MQNGSFIVFDKLGNSFYKIGTIICEMKKMGEKMSDDDIMNLIKESDEDGDGKVSF